MVESKLAQDSQRKIQLKWVYWYLRDTHKTTIAIAKKHYKALSAQEKKQVMAVAEKWAKEAGHEPDSSKPRGRPVSTVPTGNKPYLVSLPMRDLEKLKQKAEESGESVSVLIRAAVRQFLETGR
jgi:hypothetical protein